MEVFLTYDRKSYGSDCSLMTGMVPFGSIWKMKSCDLAS